MLRDDGTSGTFFWSQANGLEDIGSLGGDEMSPTAIKEMPSLGRLENVGAASRTGAFTGFTIEKKSLHAVRWAPLPASSKR